MRTRILVTGTGGTGTGASIIQALRQPGVRDRWDLTAADCDPFSWGLYAADRGVLVPRVRGAKGPALGGYMEAVAGIVADHAIGAVIPGTEDEVVLLAGRRDELPVPVIANDARLMVLMRDKRRAQEKLAALGLPHIRSYPWCDRDLAVKDFGFPLVLKPMKNTSGSRGLHLVTDQRELDAVVAAVPPYDYDVYLPDIQPYLGDAEHEYTVGVLSARDGTVIDSIVIRRHLTGFSLHTEAKHEGRRVAVSTGFSQGFIVRDEMIQGFCEDLAVRLGSTGPMNFQLRLHDGQPYVFEIHPRFSFSASLRASAGFNEPDVLLRHWLDGETPGRQDYRADVAVIRAFTDVTVPVSEMLA